MEGVYLDDKGDLAIDFDIMYWETFPNWTCNKVKLGSLDRKGLSEDKFKLTVDQDGIRRALQVNEMGKIIFFSSIFCMSCLKSVTFLQLIMCHKDT